MLRAAVRRACERARLLRENQRLRVEVRRLGPSGEILGPSEAMRALRETIARVAPAGSTVLIEGETGTGKELAARAIHDGSPRAAEPFVAVNCAALPETLLESELFGHERGAFTGADRARRGSSRAPTAAPSSRRSGRDVPVAPGEAPPSAERLARRPSGSNTSRPVDVRLVVATHRDLRQRVREGSFREDLYYRIAVVPISIPPLRDRIEDLPVLVESLLDRLSRDLNLPVRRIRAEALAKLARYRFPGNVRELRNLLERACILARGDALGPDDFPLDSMDPDFDRMTDRETPESAGTFVASLPEKVDLRQVMHSVERALLARALRAGDGVQAEAARGLGISRSDMAYKLRKHRLVEGS